MVDEDLRYSKRIWPFVLIFASLLLILTSARGQVVAPGGTTGSTGGTTGSTPGSPSAPPNSYVRTYGGGGKCYFKFGASSPEYSSNYGSVSGGWGGSFSSAWQVRCEGTITTTFTWTGPDEPPASAIIVESGTASGYANPGTSTSDNGLGVANGVSKYTIRSNPGASFSITRSPSAVSTSSIPNYSAATAGVAYSASVVPVVVTLDNATNVASTGSPATYATLIGKGMSASISASGFVLSGWSWTIPGDKFAGFKETGSPGDPAGAIPFEASDLSLESPFWYWKTATSSAAVTCTATAKIGGQTIGTVTGKQTVDVRAPTGSLGANLFSNKYYYRTGSNPVAWTLVDGGPVPNTIVFNASIDLPPPFDNDGGVGRFVQLVSGTEKQSGSPDQTYIDALDAAFPYPNSADFAPGAPGTAYDSPAIEGINTLTSFDVNLNLTMYLLYKPSGATSTWVPLQKMNWNASFAALRTSLTSPWPFTSPNIVPGSSTTKGTSTIATDHPSWTIVKP